jgi:type IV secretory pathway VirB4 component
LDKDTTIQKIDEIIMTLSKSKKQSVLLTPDEVKAIQSVYGEDQQKLANRLEDLVVLLRDDPDNKKGIRDARQVTFNEFGHVPPVWSVLKSVESLY